MTYPWERRLGATPTADGCTFRVWAQAAPAVSVSVRLADGDHPLDEVGYGMWEGEVAGVGHGDRYRFVLDGDGEDEAAWPDPCSRWQPEGLRGPSAVVDPARFTWTDRTFAVPSLADLVVYELHVGTFTEAGTFDAAVEHLAGLADIGITAVEVMPVGEFPGRWGWGYDGVYLSAAQSSYGGPEGLARLVDAAHAAGVAVLLDVVYNHVGPTGGDGLRAFGPYFTAKYSTPWGDAVNYDDAGCDPVREWVLQSAEGWLRDFHLDGLRVDAVHAIFDQGARHVMPQLAERCHAARAGALVIAESGLNDPKVIRPVEAGGFGHDAAWADDFHHSLRALLTGDRSGWYEEFGSVAQLAKAFHRPHVHDGGYSTYRHRRFGAPAEDRRPEQFVVFAQNHDQVGNRAFGDRLPREVRPLAAFCVLLSTSTPMLFMGEEYGEDAPFQFFTDHIDRFIADATRDGRRREFARFASFREEDVPDPQDRATFRRSKLTRIADPGLADLYRRLLALRRQLRVDADVPADVAASDITFDEHAGWLLVRRGRYELAANFSTEVRSVPVSGSKVVLSTVPVADPVDGAVRLPPRGGAVLSG